MRVVVFNTRFKRRRKRARNFELLKISGSFQEETKRLSEALKNSHYLKETIKEYERFLTGYRENRDVLRFHYHKVDSLYQKLQELELPRKEYTSNLTELLKVKAFITEDEVLAILSMGNGVDRGRERITEFFKENHTLQEKANFLKDENGIGRSSHAVAGAMFTAITVQFALGCDIADIVEIVENEK